MAQVLGDVALRALSPISPYSVTVWVNFILCKAVMDWMPAESKTTGSGNWGVEEMHWHLRSPGGAFVLDAEREWVKRLRTAQRSPSAQPLQQMHVIGSQMITFAVCASHMLLCQKQWYICIKNKNTDSSYSMITSTYWATSKRLTNQGCSSHVKPCSTMHFPEKSVSDVRGFTSYSWKQCWVRICPQANPYPEAYPSKHDSIWAWSPWGSLGFHESESEALMLGLAS